MITGRMSDAEARELRRRILSKIMYSVKMTGETPAYGFISFENLLAIEQVAEAKDEVPTRDMVGGVLFSGQNLEPDEVVLVTKYKLPL